MRRSNRLLQEVCERNAFLGMVGLVRHFPLGCGPSAFFPAQVPLRPCLAGAPGGSAVDGGAPRLPGGMQRDHHPAELSGEQDEN